MDDIFLQVYKQVQLFAPKSWRSASGSWPDFRSVYIYKWHKAHLTAVFDLNIKKMEF